MSKFDKLIAKLLSGRSDKNFQFDDIRMLLRKTGFTERIKGDHHIFFKDDVFEIINLQPKANQAKPYQVKQVREIFSRYKMEVIDDE